MVFTDRFVSSCIENTDRSVYTSSEKPTPARDRILDFAGPLFYQHGTRAIGVERVVAEAAVTKATFYKHFPSKDDLMVGWIHRAEEQSATLWPGVDVPEPLIAHAHAMIDVAQKEWCMG